MSNHLHALLQIADHPLGGIMQRIAMRYARHRHKSLRTTGHLFERRYRATWVDTDAYFLAVLRYIHLNPVAAGIVTDPAHYPWSSHGAYLGIDTLAWITTAFGLSLFSADAREARLSYAQFVLEDATDDNFRPPAPGIKADAAGPTGPLLASTPNATSFRPQRPASLPALQALAERICREHHVSLDRLRSLSRARALTPIRLDFITQAIDLRIASLTELARFLHRDPSALSRLLARRARSSQTLL
jgi:hypothetical protein